MSLSVRAAISYSRTVSMSTDGGWCITKCWAICIDLSNRESGLLFEQWQLYSCFTCGTNIYFTINFYPTQIGQRNGNVNLCFLVNSIQFFRPVGFCNRRADGHFDGRLNLMKWCCHDEHVSNVFSRSKICFFVLLIRFPRLYRNGCSFPTVLIIRQVMYKQEVTLYK